MARPVSVLRWALRAFACSKPNGDARRLHALCRLPPPVAERKAALPICDEVADERRVVMALRFNPTRYARWWQSPRNAAAYSLNSVGASSSQTHKRPNAVEVQFVATVAFSERNHIYTQAVSCQRERIKSRAILCRQAYATYNMGYE